jgi:hypothetical protein
MVTVPAPATGETWRPIAGTHRTLPEEVRSGRTHRLRAFEGVVAVAEG